MQSFSAIIGNMNIQRRFAVAVGVCALASFVQNASAQNAHLAAPYAMTDSTVSLSEQNWEQQSSDSSHIPEPQAALDEHTTGNAALDDDSRIDRLVKNIPYGHSLKQTWHVVDGDVDLYFEGLRVNRRNKGVSYTVNALPVVGTINRGKLKAHLGEESNLTYASDYIPLIGRIDDMRFQASTGTQDSNISLRYKIDIAW